MGYLIAVSERFGWTWQWILGYVLDMNVASLCSTRKLEASFTSIHVVKMSDALIDSQPSCSEGYICWSSKHISQSPYTKYNSSIQGKKAKRHLKSKRKNQTDQKKDEYSAWISPVWVPCERSWSQCRNTISLQCLQRVQQTAICLATWCTSLDMSLCTWKDWCYSNCDDNEPKQFPFERTHCFMTLSDFDSPPTQHLDAGYGHGGGNTDVAEARKMFDIRIWQSADDRVVIDLGGVMQVMCRVSQKRIVPA